MKTLTKAEEGIMQVLWKLGSGFIRDVLEALPEPRPHQNTVATILKILVEKEFVAIKTFGRQHQYSPLGQQGGLFNRQHEKYGKGLFRRIVQRGGFLYGQGKQPEP
jgi:BlaI family transcriptional regulator, penicillinase repressor